MRVLKSLVRDWIPPVFLRWFRLTHTKGVRFAGDFSTWEEANRHCTGYDTEGILDKVLDATQKVKYGEAVFERDSVCFYHEEYRWETLACLLTIAAERGGRLSVLDFGGALGSFYFQHIIFFSRLKETRWSVVEQKHFVECGRSKIQDEKLRFCESVEDCLAEGPVDVVFLSSVLAYLESPYDVLTALASENVPYILIDRTPFISSRRDRLTIQHVPSSIYKAIYPAWFFSREKFDAVISGTGYRLITEFAANDDVGIGEFKGLLFEKY